MVMWNILYIILYCKLKFICFGVNEKKNILIIKKVLFSFKFYYGFLSWNLLILIFLINKWFGKNVWV